MPHFNKYAHNFNKHAQLERHPQSYWKTKLIRDPKHALSQSW